MSLNAFRSAKSPTNLQTRALRAGGWLFVSHGGSQIIRLSGNLILARLLAPELFGIIAIASAVQIIAALISDVGLSQAVVRSTRSKDPLFLHTAWTVQIGRGWGIWLICALIGALLHFANVFDLIPSSSVYADERLPHIILVASLSAAILGHQSMRSILHSRELDLRPLTYMELLSALVGLITSALIAYSTRSVWSFVAGGLMSALSTTILSHLLLKGSTDHLGWNKEAFKELWRFGRWASLSSLALAFSMNGDRILLGALLSPTILGNYAIAAGLATLMEGIGNRAFSGLAFPTLSEAHRDNLHRFRNIYRRMRWLSDIAFVTTAGVLFASAELIVGILYDSRYAPAGEILKLLSFTLVFDRYNLASFAYLAAGKPKYSTVINWTKMLSLFVLVPILSALFGNTGAIVGIAIHRAPSALFVILWDRQLRMLDIRLELAAVFFWGAGFSLGYCAITLARTLGMLGQT
jgi:O-antigen/teichoic acid export membrane protein